MKKFLLILALLLSFSKSFGQIVNIPDANFKTSLVSNSSINTNLDGEIQVAEANAYTGKINISSTGVSNLTGIEAFTSLTSFNCSYNSISSLDLSFLSTLLTLECHNNSLTSLDLSSLPNLDTLSCQNNPLTFLNVANGNNSNITYFNALPNTSLTCIKVDDAAYSAAVWTLVDAASTFISKVDTPIDVSTCSIYTLPGLTVGDYYTGSGGSGTPLFSGNNITTTQTIYVYKSNGPCFDESSFLVTINPIPAVNAGIDQTKCEGDNIVLTGSGSGGSIFTWDFGVTDGLAFTHSSGFLTFTVTGTDTNGCVNTDQVNVDVFALPSVDAGFDQTLCESDPLTLNGGGAQSYTWDNSVLDGIPFFPSVGTTNFTVIGTDINGCINTDQIGITVNALPIVDAGINQTVCENDLITLSGSGANSYSWDNGIFDSNPFVLGVGVTTFTVTGTDFNGCNNTDQVDVTVNALPIVFAGNDTTVCENQNVILHGTGASSYSWDNGVFDSIPFISGVGTITYTLTATDLNGCFSTDQVDVIVNALPSVYAGIDETSCAGSSVTNSASGAVSYVWDNGVIDNVPFSAVLDTTIYTVFGTDINGCVGTDSKTVIAHPAANIGAGLDQTVCEGTLITLSSTGAQFMAWDNGVFDNTSFFQVPGTVTYTVNGTDFNGCSGSDQVSVTVNALPIVFAGNDTTVCENENVILHGIGASSYSWDNGVFDSIPFISGVGTITYTLTATDLNGCFSTDQVDVIVNALPSVYAGIDETSCAGSSVTNSASGAVSYVWDNGVIDNVPFSAVLDTTIYTVFGTDINGCVGTDSKTVIAHPAANIGAGLDQTVCEGTLITLSSTGAQFMAWDNGVFDNTSFFQVPGTVTYTVNGTDFNGCSGSDQVSVTVNALPSVDAGTNQSICENNTVILYGTGASSYSWSNGVTDSIPFTSALGSVTYYLTGTDLNACSNTDSVVVTVNTLPVVDAGNNQTLCENTSITLNGLGASTYSWDNGVVDGIAFTPTVGITNFVVTGTDLNGCSANDTLVVTVNSLPSVNAGADLVACLGSLTTVVASGGLTLSWDNGVFDNVPFYPNLGNTTLVVTGTDINGCSDKDTMILTVNPLPIVDAGLDQAVCENTSVTLMGLGFDFYTWNNGIFDNVPFTPTVGTTSYVLTGTDVNGCSANDTMLLTVNSLPTINVINSLEICQNEAVSLTATSSSPFIFWLDQSSGGNTITQNETYSSNAILTDTMLYVAAFENGCQSLVSSVQITVNSIPQISLSSTNTDCGLSNGVATASISQGTAPFNYYWSNGEQQNLSITNIETGSYYFNVEDSKGCKAIDAIEIVPSSVTITPSLVNPSCFSGSDGSIAVSVSGMAGNIHYMWNTGHQSTGISNLKAGTYEVTLRNDLGCELSSSFQLIEPSLIENELVEIQPTCGTSDGQLQVVNTSGDFAPYTYNWSNGQIGTLNSNLAYGTYILTTTDNTGCQIQKTYYLSNANGPSIIGSVSETDCSMSNGAIDVELTPQIGDFVSVISWSNGATTEDISSLSSGNYVCTATTSNNCSSIRGWNLNIKKPDLQEICIVSVDSVSTTNLVIWEKVQATGISHYNIYRESNQIGEYQLIDTVQFTNLSVFNDVVASPETRSWRYRISAVDFCGAESILSPAHKTLHLNIFDLGVSGTKVAWDEYEGTAFSTYNLLRYTDEFGWETIANLPTTALNFTDTISAQTLGLDYMLEIALDVPCTATVWRAQDFNRSRSNRERGSFSAGHGDDEFSNNEIYEIGEGNFSLNIYPNPFDNEVFLNLTGLDNLNIRITNINGKEVANQFCKTGLNTINLENLSDGMYFIVFENQFNLEAVKIIKK
ncbi:MAG: T9SS type A sorting domain-containing protein [Bacteroidota bacterium]